MTDKQTAQDTSGNTRKDPEDWVTGDEPMTGAQRSYLKTLSEEAKEPFDATLTKAQASERIDELQRITGRGKPAASSAGEEDPGAAMDDPAMRDAMRGEARNAGSGAAGQAAERPRRAAPDVGPGSSANREASGDEVARPGEGAPQPSGGASGSADLLREQQETAHRNTTEGYGGPSGPRV